MKNKGIGRDGTESDRASKVAEQTRGAKRGVEQKNKKNSKKVVKNS